LIPYGSIARVRRVLTAVGAVAVLAGCQPSPSTSDVDRRRADAVRADPVFRAAVHEPTVRVGKVLSEDLGWDRTEVSAVLYERQATDPPPVPSPADVETSVEATLSDARAQGWTVLWASCAPPPDPGYPSSRWEWEAYGYRVADGVSYWLRLAGAAQRDGFARIDVLVRAPGARDRANLFADAPTGLPAGATCVERPGVSETPERDGAAIELAARRSLPKAHPSTGPSDR
jgi:hypothetical protein